MPEHISIGWTIGIAVFASLAGNGALWLAVSARIKNLVNETVKEHIAVVNRALDDRVRHSEFESWKNAHKEWSDLVMQNQKDQFNQVKESIKELKQILKDKK